MPRPRNNDLYGRIADEVFRQMLSRGYTATSYASIADACGTSRAIVQDYFPRKTQMAILVMDRSFDTAFECTSDFCDAKRIEDAMLDSVARLYAAATTHLEFMQRDAGRRFFMRDFLKDRDNTEVQLFNIMSRSFGFIGRIDVVEDPAYRDDLLMSMGGFFEVFYYHLKEERSLDIQLYFSQVTRIWLRATGYPREKLGTALDLFALTEEQFDDAVREMDRRLG